MVTRMILIVIVVIMMVVVEVVLVMMVVLMVVVIALKVWFRNARKNGGQYGNDASFGIEKRKVISKICRNKVKLKQGVLKI